MADATAAATQPVEALYSKSEVDDLVATAVASALFEYNEAKAAVVAEKEELQAQMEAAKAEQLTVVVGMEKLQAQVEEAKAEKAAAIADKEEIEAAADAAKAEQAAAVADKEALEESHGATVEEMLSKHAQLVSDLEEKHAADYDHDG